MSDMLMSLYRNTPYQQDGAQYRPNDNQCGFGAGHLAALNENAQALLHYEWTGCPRPPEHPGSHQKWWPYSPESEIGSEELYRLNQSIARAVDYSLLEPNAVDFWKYCVVQHNGRYNMLTEKTLAAIAAGLDMPMYDAIQHDYEHLKARFPYWIKDGAAEDFIKESDDEVHGLTLEVLSVSKTLDAAEVAGEVELVRSLKEALSVASNNFGINAIDNYVGPIASAIAVMQKHAR